MFEWQGPPPALTPR